jgi:predicted membrane chloride channel (bestrophin family)
MHEVARELSNPFFTVPNDLPLNNFHSQFNEALITMYAGFHPDSWRKDEEKEEAKDSSEETR